MASIDRLGWAAGQLLRVYGARLGVRTNDATELEALAARYPPYWVPARGQVVAHLVSARFALPARREGLRNYHLLYDGPMRISRTLDRDELLETFESHLHRLVAASASKVFIHAGVVGWKGKAIVLPGRTLAGKTSLVAALMRAGAEYYSDEYAVVDREGRVHPYPKRLGIRQPERIEQQLTAPNLLGGSVGSRPLPVGMILFTRYREGAGWKPRELMATQGALKLLEFCVSTLRVPQTAVETVKRMADGALTLRTTRGEADQVINQILGLSDRSAARPLGIGPD
jgi:hypothetical protein